MAEPSVVSIKISDEDKDKWTKVLTPWYQKRGKTIEFINKKLEKVFHDCEIGWIFSPRTLNERIKVKTGYRSNRFDNLNIGAYFPSEKTVERQIETSGLKEVIDTLTEPERDWWRDREYLYYSEFKFNKSSDLPFILQLIAEELIQKRLIYKQLKKQNEDYSKLLLESQKRLIECQTKLGITREQRAGILNSAEGDVASLAASLDEKLKKAEKLLEKEEQEERNFLLRKSERAPVNIVPPPDKIEAILGETSERTERLDE